MLIENDFENDDGHRQPDGPAPAPPPPLVVIHYRNRGIPLMLVPPVLILAAVLGFQAHRRMSPPRPADVPPPGLAAVEVRPLEKGLTGAEEEAKRFLARAEPLATPALDPWVPLLPETPAGPFPDAVVVEEDQMPLPSEPEHVDEATGEPPGPAKPPAPVDPPAPGPDPFQGPVPPPPPPEPELTKEQVLEKIILEADQKAARLRILDAWKPHLLEKDRKLAEEIEAFQLLEHQRQLAAQRIPFHAELRRLVVTLGDRAGPQINSLCAKYGRGTTLEISKAVQQRLGRSSTLLGRRDKVELMRRLGAPEAYILDAITHDAKRSLKKRGGPRTMDEVIALAGRQLLAIPPPPHAQATVKPVAEASMAPVPGAGRRPQ